MRSIRLLSFVGLLLYNTVLTSKNIISQINKTFNNAFNTSKKNVSKSLNVVTDPWEAMKKELRKKYPSQATLTDDQLAVREGTDISLQEKKFLTKRMVKVQAALKKSFDINAPLKMGVCLAGGGNRAMLSALGFLLGAQDIGLFDALLYTAALSGSTWTICPFSYFYATQGMDVKQFYDQLVNRLSSVLNPVTPGSIIPKFTQFEQDAFLNNFAKRFSYGQYISSIEMYSSFIGDFTLLPAGDQRLNITWSSIADKIQEGNIPMPMGSAVAYDDSDKGLTSYYWYEVNPFEVGSDKANGYIPIQGFGAKYKKGRVVSNYAGHTPEYPLSFFEGVFGSAFTASYHEYQDHIGDKTVFKFAGLELKVSKLFVNNNDIENIRFSPATFHNFMYGVDSSSLKNKSKLKLFDGGMNFNVPLPLLMRPSRNLDIIFIGDSMVDLQGLQLAAVHCKRNNIKFPDLSMYKEDDLKKVLTVFNDPRQNNYDTTMPTIMYCPLYKNSHYSETFDPEECRKNGYCQVLNFNYTQEQADTVVNLMRVSIKDIQSDIKAVFKALQTKKYHQ